VRRTHAEPHELAARRVDRPELDESRPLVLVAVDDFVQLDVLVPDPVLRLDGYDVVAAHDLVASSPLVVDADLDDWVAGEERQAEQPDSRLVVADVAGVVDVGVVFVDQVDTDLVLGVRRRHLAALQAALHEQHVLDGADKLLVGHQVQRAERTHARTDGQHGNVAPRRGPVCRT